MNLLFVTTRSPYATAPAGGAESSIRLIAEQMACRGHRVVCLAHDVSSDEQNLANEKGVELVKGVKLRAHKLWGARSLDSYFLAAQLRALCHEYSVTHIYCYYEPRVLRAVLRLKRAGLSPKIVLRMAGLLWYELASKSTVHKRLFANAFREIDAVNYIHPELETLTKARLDELAMPVRFRNKWIFDIGSSAPVGRHAPYEELADAPFEMVMVARFSVYQKRHDLLVKAVAGLPVSVPVRLTLIGEGARRPAVEQLCRDLGLGERVCVSPPLPQEELWSRLQHANLMCHAVDYEGLGKIVVESMAIGLPVLVSDVAPLNGYVIDGRTGFVVKNDVCAWTQKIMQLIEDRSARVRVSREAMEYVTQRYDPKRNGAQYERAFRLLGDASPPSENRQ